jgi:parallel beta-helix repeat protein
VYTENTIFENGCGIYVYSVNVDIIDNVIYSNQDGIVTEMAFNINIIDNVIFSNNHTGASIHTTYNSTITGNIISNNSKEGMLISMSSDNLIRRNTFQNNFLGLKIPTGSNSIEENNFIDNTLHAYSVGRDVWSANYWDNWIGLKFNGPICQRFPKIILSNFWLIPFLRIIDWHPAQEPYAIPGMR